VQPTESTRRAAVVVSTVALLGVMFAVVAVGVAVVVHLVTVRLDGFVPIG